jgi:uncharacterized protein YdeI (YjbR/CyaY-like superfamily)
MAPKSELEVLPFASQKVWSAWLAKQHAKSPGIWLKLAKKDSGIASVTYAEALEVALCYGWIDGQVAKFDESYFLRKFTPRGPKSVWSKINRESAVALIERGAMKPAGLRAVDAAKADGRWEKAYESQRTAELPADFSKALNKDAKAKAFFATISSANRYAIIYRINDAKRPETRARRIEQFVAMLHDGNTLHG